MKKKLLKTPQNDGEILFLPEPAEFLSSLNKETIVATAHQPYFFNPGISLKFLALEKLPQENKKIIFLDIDRIHLEVKTPSPKGIYTKELIKSEEIFYDYPAPSPKILLDFFDSIKDEIKNIPDIAETVLPNINIFQEIVANQKGKLLKDVLAESFLQFYGIKQPYQFISEIFKSKEYEDFFRDICRDDISFRDIFNNALDEYRSEYRFRYKNFPFPKLEIGELPFWIVKDGLRQRCFKDDVSEVNIDKITIYPRALTLTIFLRLFVCDTFIHGVGGANYEWIGDRVIERFFKAKLPWYAVISGTFLIGDSKEREFPYFFHDSNRIRNSINRFF